MKAWTARYRGRCAACPEPIQVGQRVEWLGEPGGSVKHVGCVWDGSFIATRDHQFACRLCGQEVLEGQSIVNTADPQLFHHAECAFAPHNDGN